MFWQQFQIQRRVIGALLIRELIALYGRANIGVLWLVAEPLTFAIPVMILWSLFKASKGHGLPLMMFLWSGYMPLMMFRHMGGRMMNFIRQNSGLMYHRNVTILDISIARMTVEIVSNLAAAIILYAIFFLIGQATAPAYPMMLLIGYFYHVWWCVSVGYIVGAFSERSDLFQKFWVPYGYTYMFYSGTWFLAEWLPPGVRQFALFQPSLQASEMIRSGLFGPQIISYYNIPYDTGALCFLTFIGLYFLRSGRGAVMVE